MRIAIAIGLMFLTGVAAPVFSLLFPQTQFAASVWNVVALAFCVGVLACWLAPARIRLSMLAVFLGVAVGLSVFGLIEWIAFSRDHDLLPAGIFSWEATVAIPSALGALICRIGIAMRGEVRDDPAV